MTKTEQIKLVNKLICLRVDFPQTLINIWATRAEIGKLKEHDIKIINELINSVKE